VPQEFLAYSIPLADARPHDRGVDLSSSLDGAGAIRVARQLFRLRARLDLAAPLSSRTLDSSARGQRRRIEIAASRRVRPARVSLGRAAARAVVRSLSRAGRKHGGAGPEHCTGAARVCRDTNARAREEAEPHLDYFWQKLLSYHRGSMA